jgi:hypothetical protein
MTRSLFSVLGCWLMCLLAAPSLARDVDDVPNPRTTHGGWVTDEAHVLDAAARSIEQRLETLHEQTGAEVAWVVLSSIGDSDPRTFATNLLHTWGVGRGTEFQIDKIEMVGNTGTYLDSPFHRYADADDLSALSLSRIANLDCVVASVDPSAAGPAIQRLPLDAQQVRGKCVLIHTGWDAHWRTDRYFEGHPHLTAELVEAPAMPALRRSAWHGVDHRAIRTQCEIPAASSGRRRDHGPTAQRTMQFIVRDRSD